MTLYSYVCLTRSDCVERWSMAEIAEDIWLDLADRDFTVRYIELLI